MRHETQRIIVDGVEFDRLVRFPRILRAITQAMQPPRILLALFLVALLFAGGRLWDGLVDEPTISPAGLLDMDGELSTWDERVTQAVLRDVAGRISPSLREDLRLPPEGGTEWPRLDARAIRDAYATTYRYRRAEAIDRELSPDAIAARDAEFFATLERIEEVRPIGPFEATIEHVATGLRTVILGVLALEPAAIGRAGVELFVAGPIALWRSKPLFTIVYGLFAVLVLTIGGGALCRMAACEFAERERLRARDAMDFSFRHAGRVVFAPLLPLIVAAVLAAVLVVLGVATLWLPWLDILGGLLYGVCLLLGLLLAFVLVCYAASFFLILPAVATEGCGPTDAVQRAFAYLLSRPLHLLGYVVVGLIGLALGYLVVALVTTVALNATAAAVGALTPHTAAAVAGGFEIFDLSPRSSLAIHPTLHHEIAAWFVGLWQSVLVGLVVAYVVSYLFTASTLIYMLLRQAADGQDPSEIWRPGLLPGTLVPVPSPTPAAEPGAGPASTRSRAGRGRGEAFLAGVVRRVTSLGVRRRAERDAEPEIEEVVVYEADPDDPDRPRERAADDEDASTDRT